MTKPKKPAAPKKAAAAKPARLSKVATPTPEAAVPKPGRPAGSKNITEIVTVKASRCAKCGSTERTPYTNTLEREIAGLHEGQEYTHILWRSTTCASCGQGRRDRCFENRPKPAPVAPPKPPAPTKSPGRKPAREK